MLYQTAIKALDTQISSLRRKGVDFDSEVRFLRELRERVTPLCLQDLYLEKYRAFIEADGYYQHPAGKSNHLRDTDDKYGAGGHSFSLNREILYSYDICGSCESHAIIFSIEHKLASSVENGLLLEQIDKNMVSKNTNFQKCPI